jgi:nicotinamide mononucleotide transporter
VTDVASAVEVQGPAPWWGSSRDKIEALSALSISGVITAAYVILALQWDTPTTWVERVALVASLACVWLARTENIWAMPAGLVSVIVLGGFYLDIELVAQGWLQFVYYVPIQMLGWWAWTRGGDHRSALPVTPLSGFGWIGALAAAIGLWILVAGLFAIVYDSSQHLLWDTSIVASSVVAQTLMTYKKVAAWWWWTFPVNVSAIGLYVVTKSWALVFLYAVFLANSCWGWRLWAQRPRMARQIA